MLIFFYNNTNFIFNDTFVLVFFKQNYFFIFEGKSKTLPSKLRTSTNKDQISTTNPFDCAPFHLATSSQSSMETNNVVAKDRDVFGASPFTVSMF